MKNAAAWKVLGNEADESIVWLFGKAWQQWHQRDGNSQGFDLGFEVHEIRQHYVSVYQGHMVLNNGDVELWQRRCIDLHLTRELRKTAVQVSELPDVLQRLFRGELKTHQEEGKVDLDEEANKWLISCMEPDVPLGHKPVPHE